MNNLGWTIEKVDINKMTKKDILKMYEIERDTWSHFMGEYVKCDSCNINFSKKDIYSNKDSNYNLKTVCELEKKYGRKNIKCNCCWWSTTDIRWKELITILESRIFWTKKWFVNFYKSSVNEILAFSYWFVDSTEQTYYKEYQHHFEDKLLDYFIEKFWNSDLLTLSWVCMKWKAGNISIIYELIKQFYCSLDYSYNDLVWTWEVIINSPTHKMYKRMWTNLLWLDETYFKNKWKNTVLTDIAYHDNIVNNYREISNMNLEEFIVYTKKLVKKRIV